MAKAKATRVEVWSVKPPTRQTNGQMVRHDPVRLSPQPIRSVKGKFGSDEARKDAKEKLTKLGYTVRNITFAEGELLLVYVNPNPTPPRRPRSATTRRRK